MPLESVHLDPSPLHPMPPAAPRRWGKTGVGRSWPGARDPAIEWLPGSSPLARQVAASSPVGGSPPGRLSSPSVSTRARCTRVRRRRRGVGWKPASGARVQERVTPRLSGFLARHRSRDKSPHHRRSGARPPGASRAWLLPPRATAPGPRPPRIENVPCTRRNTNAPRCASRAAECGK
jgi:hypothetical protein